jgi:hypothetical protein
MSYADITAFDAFSGNFVDDDDVIALKQVYLDSASSIIDDYIGYSAIANDYDEYLNGSGIDSIQLSAKPITEITSITVEGVSIDPSEYYSDGEFLYCNSGVFPVGTRNVHVVYKAGYTSIPNLLMLTCIRIAALLLSESGGNIGVNSKSFGDSGTRTFVNTVNYSKYLTLLNSFVMIK